MRLTLRILPLILVLTLLNSHQSHAAFVVPRFSSVYPINDTVHGFKSRDASSFQSLYPGRRKRIATLLALPFLSMLGLYAFYLGKNRTGFAQLGLDFWGASFLYWFSGVAVGFWQVLAIPCLLILGISFLLISFTMGIFGLIHILSNSQISWSDSDQY